MACELEGAGTSHRQTRKLLRIADSVGPGSVIAGSNGARSSLQIA